MESRIPPRQLGRTGPTIVSAALVKNQFLGFRKLGEQIETEPNGENFILRATDHADGMLELGEVGDGVVFIPEKK